MDTLCIKRGTLLDNKEARSLIHGEGCALPTGCMTHIGCCSLAISSVCSCTVHPYPTPYTLTLTLTPSQRPQLHSYHCLVDIPSCVESGFELLEALSPPPYPYPYSKRNTPTPTPTPKPYPYSYSYFYP